MRLRRRQKPCARTTCGHFFEIHSMLVAGLDGEDVRVPCGHMELQPAFGGLMRLRACSCPGYVAPAPRRLRWANRLLTPRTLVFALYALAAIFGASIAWWSL